MARRSGLSIHTTVYNTFKGVDFSSDPCNVNPHRSPFCVNMVSDAGGMPEKRVGWRTVHDIGTGRVNGLFCMKFANVEKYLAHVGTKIYTWQEDGTPALVRSGVHDGRSQAAPMGGKLWIVTGGDYLCWDGETVADVTQDDAAKAPTTVISRDPAGGGQPYEDISLTCRYRVNSFLADGNSREYLLDGSIDETGEITVTVDGETVTSGWTAFLEEGKLVFDTAPPAPLAGAADNVQIKFPHTVEGYADRIRKCTIITTYGVGETNRVILSGNPDYPNQDWTSAVYDPSYIPDLSYAAVGLEGVAIRGYCRMGESLGIVKEPHEGDSSLFLRTASLDSDGNAVFPIRAALAGVGAINSSCFARLLDEPLFLTGTGIYALTSSIYTSERLAQNRSYFLNGALTREEGLEKAVAVQWNGMYLLSLQNGHVYVLDGSQAKSYRRSNQPDFSYEGYFWDDIPAVCWMVRNDGAKEHLWFGTEDGRICRMNNDIEGLSRFADDGKAIRSVWSTKLDDDGDATVEKTMIKRGSAVTIKPSAHTSAQIYIIKDEEQEKMVASGSMSIFDWTELDFEDFTFETYDGPHDIMLHTKVKKYKRLQVLVANQEVNQGFGLFAVTKHFVSGNFAKK